MTEERERFDLLVVAAHAPDLHGLRRHLGAELRGRIQGLSIVGRAVGMGLAASGSATMRRILQTRPRAVVMLGTCGVYPGMAKYQPYDLVVPSGVRLLDHAVIARKSAFPEPMITEGRVHGVLGAGLAAIRPRTHQVLVASPLAQTVDDQVAASVPGALGTEAENLEAFAVAHACQLVNVPFAAVFGVTHQVGSRGMDDWRRFGRDATSLAGEVLATWAHNGAPGLPHAPNG